MPESRPNKTQPNQKKSSQGVARAQEQHQGRPQQRDDLPKHRHLATDTAKDDHRHDPPGKGA